MIEITIEKKLFISNNIHKLCAELRTRPGDKVVIYGKSGSGKTSLLKMIAGIIRPDEGRITMQGHTWFDATNNTNLPIQQRGIGFVFQDLALFPHMTVLEHLLFAQGKQKDSAYLDDLLNLTQLNNFTDKKPKQLSGGQQQRLAIIRALARKPQFLLLDEPFSALDPALRSDIRKELDALQTAQQFTLFLVSHDKEDTLGLANSYIELKDGKAFQQNNQSPSHSSAIPGVSNDNIIYSKDTLNYTGSVQNIYPIELGYILDIQLNNEVLKLPVDAHTASKFNSGDTIKITTQNGQIVLMTSG